MSQNIEILKVGRFMEKDDRHESQIVERAKTDPQAFGLLFDKYYDDIFNYLLHRTADINLAEELVSETFFKALNNITFFKWRNIPFSAWLYRIATNELNGYYRKKQKSKNKSIDEIVSEEISSDINSDSEIIEAERQLEKSEMFLSLHSAISLLKPKYQEVITLRYFEKKSINEISEITSKSPGTIKSLIHRGLAKLKNELNSSLYEEIKNG